MILPLLLTLGSSAAKSEPEGTKPLILLNLTASHHNFVGFEAGGGWGKCTTRRCDGTIGFFASVEPGWRGYRLRSGFGSMQGGEMTLGVWRLGIIGLSDGWSGSLNQWGPETTLGLNLLLVRTGMAFGTREPVQFLWAAGIGF
ncbi:MAG: hypothetical protein IPK50_11905 [Fibrobacterota bacterium]|nr:hypothetical protein [Fibrobacterota bacterium]QQS07575.1 MAG: hypothetical protein IPK50_11905 [Fibrobacterota bacterium]